MGYRVRPISFYILQCTFVAYKQFALCSSFIFIAILRFHSTPALKQSNIIILSQIIFLFKFYDRAVIPYHSILCSTPLPQW